MTWEPRPVPDPTPETERYWEGAADGQLLLTECTECGFVPFPPRAVCPDCLADTEWIEADGDGTIYSYTVVRNDPDWPDEHLPAVIAFVTLPEGPTMMAGLPDADPGAVDVGADVTVAFAGTENESIGIPVFELAD